MRHETETNNKHKYTNPTEKPKKNKKTDYIQSECDRRIE